MTSIRAAARHRRQGLTIIPVMVSLVLVTLFTGIMMKQVASHRATTLDEQRRLQAEWLAESGLARASARLSVEDSYVGETWTIAAEELDGHAGVVRIVVEAVKGRPAQRGVRVEADYPAGDGPRARISKSMTLDLKPEIPGGPQ